MDDERKETKILILCVLGAICVIIIAIIALIGIWTPDNEEQETSQNENTVIDSIGEFETINFSMDDQVSKYADTVATYLTTKNIDKLYEITNPEYLEYFNLDKEGLNNLLEQKGFYGTVLSGNEYNSATYDSNKYIRLELNSKDNNYIDTTVNIIEYSPNDYKIAFDKFVFYKKEPVEYIREDLDIVISEQVAYDTRYEFNINITNNTGDTVYINSDEAYEFIYLDNSTSVEISPAVHLYAGKKVSISSGKSINMKLNFNIDDMTINNISGLIIKGVNISKTGVNTDIELPL